MKTRIKNKKSRFKVCSLKDFTDKSTDYSFYRKGIYEGWGEIKAIKPSTFAQNGYVVDENGNKISHLITMNYRYDIDITNAAWLYRERLKSAPEWFRILSVMQVDNSWLFYCRLFEKSDDAIKPVNDKPKETVFSPVALDQDIKL